MTLKRAFIEYMESKGFGTFGVDLFLNGAPLDSPNNCWWVLAAGGSHVSENKTGEKIKNYTLSVFHRSLDAEELDQEMHAFEEELNTQQCDQLTGFETIDISVTTFPSDQDIDNENRTISLAQVTVQTYL